MIVPKGAQAAERGIELRRIDDWRKIAAVLSQQISGGRPNEVRRQR